MMIESAKHLVIKAKRIGGGLRGTGKGMYYPTAVSRGTVSMQELAQRMAEKSAMNKGDILCVLVNLATEMKWILESGHSVKIDDLGTFSTVVECKGQGVEKEEWVSRSMINRVRVRFRECVSRRK